MREKEKVIVEVISEREAKRRFRKPGKPVLQIYSPEGKIAEWKSEDIPDLYCDFCGRVLTVKRDEDEEEKPLFVIENSDLVCEECFKRWKGWMEKDNFEVEIIGGEE